MNKKKIVELLPYSLQKYTAKLFGSIYAQERYGLIHREWHAYGLLHAAKYCKSLGYNGFTSIEFGVASGQGLLNMIKVAGMIERELNIKIKCYGFDTGKGLTDVIDYRDHPERWKQGDYVMPDPNILRKKLGKNGVLVLGEIKETLPEFINNFDVNFPIGFVSSDVDLYSSTKQSLSLFNNDIHLFLPVVHTYFDDCHGSGFTNKFCGELLAIEEFNDEHEDRKIDIDRSVRSRHPKMGYKDYFEKMYLMHLFKHQKRVSINKNIRFV